MYLYSIITIKFVGHMLKPMWL